VEAEGDAQFPVDGVVHVEVRDVSLADAPSTVVAATEAESAPDADGAVAELEVDPADVPAGARLSLRVHWDLSGDGRVAPGDWVTTQSYPVEVGAGDRELVVRVRRVT
jgi:putative lipoprotein